MGLENIRSSDSGYRLKNLCSWLGYFSIWIHRICSFPFKQQNRHSPATFSSIIYWLWYWFIWMQWRFHNKCIKARLTNYGRFRIIIPIYCALSCLHSLEPAALLSCATCFFIIGRINLCLTYPLLRSALCKLRFCSACVA
jgi:hypothetical protein